MNSLRARSRSSLLTAAAAVTIIAGCVTGCTGTAAPSPSEADATPTSIGPLGDGFLSGTTPTPEATVNPEAGSWEGVEPPTGYRVVLISAGEDSATNTLVSAVTEWAASRNVDLVKLTALDDDGVETQINAAVELAPDLVVGAGSGIVDVFALLTPQHLGQQFLAVGAELAEPTGNATAVVWEGATFRGSGLSSDDERDPAAVTPERASEAISAGVASVLHGLTGIVLHLEF